MVTSLSSGASGQFKEYGSEVKERDKFVKKYCRWERINYSTAHLRVSNLFEEIFSLNTDSWDGSQDILGSIIQGVLGLSICLPVMIPYITAIAVINLPSLVIRPATNAAYSRMMKDLPPASSWSQFRHFTKPGTLEKMRAWALLPKETIEMGMVLRKSVDLLNEEYNKKVKDINQAARDELARDERNKYTGNDPEIIDGIVSRRDEALKNAKEEYENAIKPHEDQWSEMVKGYVDTATREIREKVEKQTEELIRKYDQRIDAYNIRINAKINNLRCENISNGTEVDKERLSNLESQKKDRINEFRKLSSHMDSERKKLRKKLKHQFKILPIEFYNLQKTNNGRFWAIYGNKFTERR